MLINFSIPIFSSQSDVPAKQRGKIHQSACLYINIYQNGEREYASRPAGYHWGEQPRALPTEREGAGEGVRPTAMASTSREGAATETEREGCRRPEENGRNERAAGTVHPQGPDSPPGLGACPDCTQGRRRREGRELHSKGGSTGGSGGRWRRAANSSACPGRCTTGEGEGGGKGCGRTCRGPWMTGAGRIQLEPGKMGLPAGRAPPGGAQGW